MSGQAKSVGNPHECTLKYISRATKFPGNGTPVLSQEQANFLLSDAAKSLTPKEAAGLKADESYERFKEIRWGWQKGQPYCPHCGYARVYELKCRSKFSCRSCGRQFSVTSRTIFHARKLPYQTILRAIAMRIHDAPNALQMSYALGVQYNTSYSLTKRFRIFGNANLQPKDINWPYVTRGTRDPNNMLSLVSKAIPQNLPEQVRADVGQDIIVGLLSGAFTEAQLTAQVHHYVRNHYSRMEWRFDTVSLDSPVPGTDGVSYSEFLLKVPPDQIEETYRSQIESARMRAAEKGQHLSFEETEALFSPPNPPLER